MTLTNSRQALIIFLKYPELGRSKTRLAATIGNENALKVYIELLDHTYLITKNLNIDKYLFYDKLTVNKMDWKEDNIFHAYQIESDLGGRMESAFQELFKKGYEQIVIIGSDCYDLTSEIIINAFKKLQNKDLVIGPAKDGGYYLLGMNKLQSSLFQDVPWSTSEVLNLTIKAAKKLQISYDLLPVLSDIDVYEDLNENLKSLIK